MPRKSHLRLLPNLPTWQTWPDRYDPSDEELAKLTNDERWAYEQAEFERSLRAHPTNSSYDCD